MKQHAQPGKTKPARKPSQQRPEIEVWSEIILHRGLHLPCWPEAECGPVAIPMYEKTVLRCTLDHAAWLAVGRPVHRFLGVRSDRIARVDVIVPIAESRDWLKEWKAEFIGRRGVPLRIIEWTGGEFPKTDAQIIVVWGPRKMFPRRLTLEGCAERLIDLAFGAGVVCTPKYLCAALDSWAKSCGSVTELLMKRASLLEQARRLLGYVGNAGRCMTGTQQAEYTQLLQDAATLLMQSRHVGDASSSLESVSEPPRDQLDHGFSREEDDDDGEEWKRA